MTMKEQSNKNVSSNKTVFDISTKEITIPLAEYTDLIAKETILDQVRHVVSKEACDYGTLGILTAILQIDTRKTIKSARKEDTEH